MNKKVDINRLNYESFVIDYLDGSLDAIETACFIAFLENNPDIKEEIAELNEVVIVSDDSAFMKKASLKKKQIISVSSIDEENYEEFFIAHNEGDLSDTQEAALEDFLDKNGGLNDEFELHGKLKVQPPRVIFLDKESLKHRSYVGVAWYSSAAAAILLIMASWFFMVNQEQNMRGEFASLSKIDSRNSMGLLSSNTLVKIEMGERQVVPVYQPDIIQQLESTELIANREILTISPVESKNGNEQLVDTYIFSRIIEQPTNSVVLQTEVFGTELALAENTGNDNSEGLIKRIFNNQISKIAQGVKVNRKTRRESTDPTYVKVIDGGLLVFKTLTGSETSTVKTYNQDGELTGYQIEGREVLMNGNFAGRSSQ